MKTSSTVFSKSINGTVASLHLFLCGRCGISDLLSPVIPVSPATLYSATSLVSGLFSFQLFFSFQFWWIQFINLFFHWSCILCHIWAILLKVTNLFYIILYIYSCTHLLFPQVAPHSQLVLLSFCLKEIQYYIVLWICLKKILSSFF